MAVQKPALKPQAAAKPAAQSKPGQAPQPRPEDVALAIPAVANVPESALFKRFCEEIVPKLTLPPTSLGLLEAYRKSDVKAEQVSQFLKDNPYYEHQLFKRIQSFSAVEKKEEDLPKVEGALIQLGMEGSRNLILALQALRTVHGTHPDWGKDGKKLVIDPSTILKYALRTETALLKDKTGNRDTAFAAGFPFDLMDLIAAELLTEKKQLTDVRAYIEAVYTNALKTAEISLSIGKLVPTFTLNKFLFSACMMHDAGKILMAILDPKYIQFQALCSDKKVRGAVRRFAEQQKFGINHVVLCSIACSSLKLFKATERSILFHREPYLLRSGNRQQYQLAALVRLSSNIASNPAKIEKEDDPVLQIWKGPELQDLKISAKALIEATQKIGV